MPNDTDRKRPGHVSPLGQNPVSKPSAPPIHLHPKSATLVDLDLQHFLTRDTARPRLTRWRRACVAAPS